MLGGIGSGFLELWPDGCIHDWSIFNRGHWGYRQDFWNVDREDRLPLGEMKADALQFYVRTCAPGQKPIARRLTTDGELMNVAGYNTWMQNVASIAMDYTFPGATLRYQDNTLPVEVTGQFFSPILPHELQTSGTPGAYMVFTFRNTSSQPQDISLASYLRNPLARGGDDTHRGAAQRQLHTTVTTDQATTYLTMRTAAMLPFRSTTGTMCLSMSGGEPSWIAMDFGEYLLGRTVALKPWNQRFETALRGFRETGRLPDTSDQPCPTTLGPLTISGGRLPDTQALPTDTTVSRQADIARLTDEQVGQIIAEARQIPSLQSLIDQASEVDPTLLDPTKHGRDLVDLLAQAVSQYAGVTGQAMNWGDGMLCTSFHLKPGEEHQVRVILSWDFPTHLSPDKSRNMGHRYNTWFADAEASNRFLTAHADEFHHKVNLFRNTLRESTLPPEIASAVSTQLNTLIGSSWWTLDGKVGIWEGLGSCGLNTVDVAYQGSHPLPALFPEFEKNWTALAATYQNDTTGRLYHLLPSDLDKGTINNGYGYVDVNCDFVLMLCRDYLWFGDKEYLKSIYPHVVKELGVFEAMDSDGDGLPDQHTGSCTYDTWALQGTPSYLGSLWIGALSAGIRLADDMGDTANAAKWRDLHQRAVSSLNEKLWNGEYYSLWVDGPQRDETCLTDQLTGEMYTRLIGLGNSLPPERVRQTLASIYKYNFDPDQGLFNGSYPPQRQPHMPAFQNVQAQGNFTGIEYATAAMMIDQGMVDQGLSIIQAVQRRYERSGRFFNHEECGPHYYRPMSIWAAFLAATGFKVDAPAGSLTIAPPLPQPQLRAPWVSATGWGEFTRTATSFTLDCRDGKTSFRTLRINVPVRNATLDGTVLPCTIQTANGLTTLNFANPVTIKAGQKLTLD